MNKKGKLIVLEGIDSSGKQTQAEMLQEYLTFQGKDTILRSFPFYDSHSGICIQRYLKGEEYFSQKTINMIYSVNRYEQRYWLNLFLNNDTIVILDRYYFSNMTYGCPPGEMLMLRMLEIEDMDSEMPHPDLVIHIDITAEESFRRSGKDADRNEKDIEYLKRVAQNYRKLSLQYNNWFTVNGEESKEEIHEQICAIVNDRLFKK